jgi:hypothetical protein
MVRLGDGAALTCGNTLWSPAHRRGDTSASAAESDSASCRCEGVSRSNPEADCSPANVPIVASKDYPDPIADWFKRHGVKLAVTVFVVIMLSRLPQLFEGTTRGIVGFVYTAAFFGLLSWSWGSRQNRSEAAYWFKFATLWTALLVIQIGTVVLSLARGNPFQWRGLVSITLVALFALLHWWPYSRIKSGKPFPIQRT